MAVFALLAGVVAIVFLPPICQYLSPLRFEVLFVASVSVYTLAVTQLQDSGPLFFVKMGPAPFAALAVCAIAAGLLRGRRRGCRDRKSRLGAKSYSLEKRTIWVVPLLVAFLIAAVSSELVNEARLQQAELIMVYLGPAAVFILLPRHEWRLPLVGVLAASVIQVIVALVFGPYVRVPGSGVEQLSGGVHPNILGLEAALIAVALAWMVLFSRSKNWRIAAALSFIVPALAITLAVSRTGFLSTIVGVISLIALRMSAAQRILAGVGLVFMTIFVVAGIFDPAFLEQWFVRGDPETLSSLTGRTDIWLEALRYWTARPVLGWGFGALYSEDNSAGEFLLEVRGTNAHNAGLQLLVETGVVGFGIISGLTILSIARSFRVPRSWRPLILALWIVLLFNAIGSAGLATVGLGGIAYFALVVAACHGSHGRNSCIVADHLVAPQHLSPR